MARVPGRRFRGPAARLALAGLALLLLACEPAAEAPPAAGDPWRPEERALLRSLSLESLGDPPPAEGNRLADDPRAAALGHRLFFDPALSAGGEISCAHCHQPARHFTDGRPTSVGLGPGLRNAPSPVGGAWRPWHYWDGRRDSLWSQALTPLEASNEMGSTRIEVVRQVTGAPRYRGAWSALFGPPPDLSDPTRFPARAGPLGDDPAREAWRRMDEADRWTVSRAFAGIGKAIAAYERRLRPGPGRFDAYVERVLAGDQGGAADLLSAQEIAGLRLFLDPERSRCLRCHNGPLFTNHSFHDVGTSRMGGGLDLGRFLGIQALLLDEFNCLGPFSDAPPGGCDELRFLERRELAHLSGAFRTPGLREVARTAPYFHGGALPDLSRVMAHYADPPDSPGNELLPTDLDPAETAALIAFLGTLSGGVDAEPRWLGAPDPESDALP